MKHICAWCKAELPEDDEEPKDKISHDICAKCTEAVFLEADEPEKQTDPCPNHLTATGILDRVEKSGLGFGFFKYVRVNGVFRFSDVLSMLQHVDLVSTGEKAESAGIIDVRKDCFRFRDYGSESLWLEWSEEDVALLVEALGRPLLKPEGR